MQLHQQQIERLKANAARKSARNATRMPGAEKRAYDAAVGTAMERALEALQQTVPGTIAEAEANLIRELAITYDRRAHLPHIALVLDWPIGVIQPDEIIRRLQEAIIEDGYCRRVYGRPYRWLSVRRLVRRAYVAERLERFRQCAAAEDRSAA